MYDAVLLWAYGVNRTLEEGGEPDNGLAITNNIFNFTFYGGVTGDVSIDHKGDRKFDQTLSIIQPGKQVSEIFAVTSMLPAKARKFWSCLEFYTQQYEHNI